LRFWSAVPPLTVKFAADGLPEQVRPPQFGVPSTAYYSNVHGFSPRHLVMARSAIASIAGGGSLDVRSTGGDAAAH